MIHQCRDGKFNFPPFPPSFITFTSGSIPHNNARNDNTYIYIKRAKKGLQVLIGGVTRQRMMMEKQNSIIQIPLFFAMDNNSIEPKALRISA